MKRNDYGLVLLDFTLVLSALFILLCPLIKINNIKYILIASLILHGFINAFKFLIIKKYDDLECLYVSIAEAFFASGIYLFNIGLKSKDLAFFLLIWLLVQSIIKLIKGDYYHDRHNKLWITKVFSLIIFMLTGIITCMNFNISSEATIVAIGYFFLITYVIDLLNQIYEIVRAE